jgi:predicted nucleic acid-binding protein
LRGFASGLLGKGTDSTPLASLASTLSGYTGAGGLTRCSKRPQQRVSQAPSFRAHFRSPRMMRSPPWGLWDKMKSKKGRSSCKLFACWKRRVRTERCSCAASRGVSQSHRPRMIYLLDTNAWVQFLRSRQALVVQRIQARQPAELRVCSVVMGCGCGMTCLTYLKAWQRAGIWQRLREVLLAELQEADRIDWSRAAVDCHRRPRRASGGDVHGFERSRCQGGAARGGRSPSGTG